MEEYYPALSATAEKYRKRIQSKIYYCYNCQPFEGGEPFWIQGDKIDMVDLLIDNNVPEKYWKEIADQLFCSSCGTPHLGLGADVGLQTKFEKELSSQEKKAKAIYGKEVVVLEELLSNYPLLAFQNKFAKKIYNEIKKNKFPIATIKGEFYRARIVGDPKLLTSAEMLNAPLGKPLEGRFNHAGQSHLYLTDSKETALLEASPTDSLVWCQKVVIKKGVSNILDLTFDWLEMTPSTSALLLSLNIRNTLRRTDRNKENWKPDYCITRFIMDCAKSLGYSGIKYSSAKEFSSYNVVLFYPDKVKLEDLEKPSLEQFRKK
jgi:hypothetical protein